MKAMGFHASGPEMPYNSGMNHLDILLPFGLPPTELTRDILRELNMPALATLVARAKGGSQHQQVMDEFARALPHEVWLSQRFGLSTVFSSGANTNLNTNFINDVGTNSTDKPSSSPPVAIAAMRAAGLDTDQGHWFILHPAHIHVARDHLVLTDIRQISLSEQESRFLFEEAKPLFVEDRRTLLYGDANTWFMRADDWQHLNTATPDAACGHNVDIWMPHGQGDRAWRKLQNEVQMQWFENSLNEQRAMSGKQAVNSLWLWGGASVPPIDSTSTPKYYSHAFNLHGWLRAFDHRPLASGQNSGTVEEIVNTPGERAFLLLDYLIAPALTGEWSEWIQQFQAMERNWFNPLLLAMQNGKLKQLTLTFTDNTRIGTSTTTSLSLKKFWVKPSLKATFTGAVQTTEQSAATEAAE